MRKSDFLRNLRGGVVYAAAGVSPGTARAWTANNGLEIGQRPGDGHPRYDLTDATKLLLMNMLTTRLRMAADAATSVVNHAGPTIATLADVEMSRIDDRYFNSVFEDRFLVLDRVDGEREPEIRTSEQHNLFANDGSIAIEVVIDLVVLVGMALTQVANAQSVVSWGDKGA